MFFISYFVLSFMLHSLLWYSLCRTLLVYTCLVNLLFAPPLCKCNIPITTYMSCLEKLNYSGNSATNGLPYLFIFWSVSSRIVPTSWAIKYVIVTKKSKEIRKGLIKHTFLYLVENCYTSIFFELSHLCLVKHKLYYSLWRFVLIFTTWRVLRRCL